MQQSFDVAIIGAGPAGLYASYCSSLLGFKSCIVEALDCVGGQCSFFYPKKSVYGVPGVWESASSLVESLSIQAFSSNNSCLLNSSVSRIEKIGEFFYTYSSVDSILSQSKYLIITSGVGEMSPIIPHEIDGIDSMIDSYVRCFCAHCDLYDSKTVIVAGGGDSAIDSAIHISKIAKKVIIVHRRKALSCTTDTLSDKNITILLDKTITRVSQDERGKFIQIVDNSTLECDTIFSDYLVFCYGFSSKNSTISGINLKMTGRLIDVNIETMETSERKCFAAGDCVSYPGKKRNLISCFFEADKAVKMIAAENRR